MTKIVCDNIIFELQAKGGVSRYWAENMSRHNHTLFDFSYVEGQSAHTNVYRRAISAPGNIIAERGPLMYVG